MWVDFEKQQLKVGVDYDAFRLTAVLFFDPKFANSKEIIDLLDYLDAFSANHLDILITGCTLEPPEDSAESVTEISFGLKKGYYTAKTLHKDVQRFESVTSWQFSGEIDVVMFNQRGFKNEYGVSGVARDYKNAIVLNLYRMLTNKKITSYSAFFSELIRFARDYQGDNPTWGISDTKLWIEVKRSLFESLKKYIGFRKFQIRVEDYAVKNIGKGQPWEDGLYYA
ncbi:MAG: hypothetical protein ABFD81_08745 [Syntrophaceae bacterium]